MIVSRNMMRSLTMRALPFSDAVSDQLPLGQLLRLSLFQISVGMAAVMLLGTLNRVMIVELSVPAVLSGDQAAGPEWAGEVGAALAFLLTGIGMHMTQTAGLALAADRATEETRPQVVALLYVMFLIGMGVSAVIVGALLQNFSDLRLVQVVQGTAVVTIVLNMIALWKQEKVNPMTKAERVAFNMQDVLLEPYGGEVLGLSVSATTLLTAMWAGGALLGFGLAARWLKTSIDPFRMAARGILMGLVSFCAVIFAAPLASTALFFIGAFGIGLGGGLFAVATLTAAMTLNTSGAAGKGLALGAWGAAQATAAGLSIFLGGALRDLVNTAASNGTLGDALSSNATGYSVVYHVEIGLLFVTLVALGPLRC